MMPPIFFVSGAFGAGKTTLAPLLAKSLPDCYVLDCDWLMEALIALARRDLYEEAEAWPALGNLWFALAQTNAVAGRPSIILSPAEPRELEILSLRGSVGASYWLLLDCEDRIIKERLRGRDWQGPKIQEALVDARRMRDLGLPTIRTDLLTIEQARIDIVEWVRSQLP